MARFILVALFLCSLLCLISVSTCQLRPYGRNVRTKYEYYYVTELTSTRALRSRRTCTQTCTTHFMWCWKKKTVCKRLYYYEWKTVYKKVRRSRRVYVCKQGWAPSGIGCTKPICTGGCGNGGSCIAPQTCRCTAGWTGTKCYSDVNECKTSQNRCGYKPGCRNTRGSYRCSCSSGYYLSGNGRSCTDVNECSSGRHSCGQHTTCVNLPGTYSCPCKTGFAFNTRNVCEDIDECSSSSGIVHGCQMKCNNNIGSYSCSCDKGYYLTSNRRDCSDHDECKGNVHGCEQQCINLPGGYNCSCSAGYRLNDKDLKTCDDINECSENISGCAQNCKNTIGGFTCYCNRGYILGRDSLSCIDINECSEPVNYCQHKCINTPGSYLCACRQGFYLNYDGKTCTGRPCFPIYNPINGIMNCSGYVTEDICHFDCLPGYELTGSKTRTCDANKQWTGNHTECEIIHCTTPSPPPNGFVYSPCLTRYGSQCSLGCNSGYFAELRKLTCDENGFWKPRNVSCNQIKVCQPNPCLHNGICSVVSEDQYSCNCTHTGYKGTQCEVGYFNIVDYPTIFANVISPPVAIISSPPNDYVVLHVTSRDLKFAPSTLIFNRDTSINQSFRITARETGYYLVRYSISGPSAREFSLPEEDVLFVKSHENSTDTSSIEESTLFFPFGCHKKQVAVCPGVNLTPIFATSTSPFVSFGPLTATEGIVTLEVGNVMKLPLSLRGLNLPHTSEKSLPDSCDDNDPVSYSTESLIRSRVLVKSFTDIVADSLPTWMNITLSENNMVKKTPSSDLMTHFLTGMQLQDAAVGLGLPVIGDMFYSLLATKNLNVTIEDDVNIFQSNALSLVVELCRELPSNIILQRSSEGHSGLMKNMHILKNLRKYGWTFNFDSIQFSKTSTLGRPEKEMFWDGQNFVNLGASPGGNLAAVSSLKKHFQNSTFADITMEFEGTLIGNVNDIDQIIDSPLHQHWNVDLYGSIAMTIAFKMQGQLTKLLINGPDTEGYASFGGDVHKELHGGKRGFFFTTILDEDPFMNTSLRNFVDMKTDSNFSCFLDTRLYNEKNRFHHSEKTNSISCALHGSLKVGLLRFSTVQVNLVIGSNGTFENGVQLTGRFSDSEDPTFGIFKRHLGSCVNVRFLFTENTPGYVGSFCAIINIFGMEKSVNVSISNENIKFQVLGKMYSRFDASMNCSSRILPWGNQIFDVDGQFERITAKADFVTALMKELESYGRNSISQAMKRIEAIDQTIERARVRLEKVLSIKEVALNKLQQLTNDHAFAKKQFETAKRTLKSLEIDARNYSKDIDKLKLDLDNLCHRKQCDEVCQEGVHCTTCYKYVTEKSKGMCPATCFRTEQRLIPPYSEIVSCDRQKCKRIHSTNGFFKRVFGGLIGGIVKSVLSLAITGVATVLGAPPPVAGALGSGITTLLDTGRVDEILCSASKGFLLAGTGGKSPLSIYKEAAKISKKVAIKQTGIALARKGASAVVGKVINCQREQKDGYWKCEVVQVQCNKGRYEYEYEHYPFECKKSCVVETIKRTVEKSCCKSVTCASFVTNITCLLANAVCKKARIDALEKISKTKSQAKTFLKNLEYARSNASYWNIKMHKRYNTLLRQQRWVNMTLKSAHSLEKTYNSTIKSRKNLDELLSKPLKIMSLFNEQLTSADGIKIKRVRFKAKVFPNSDNTLLPIVITFETNGTIQELSTVFDFAQINTSLKSISEELFLYISENSFSNSRKKRSIDLPASQHDTWLLSLKKYHTYCAKFTNHYDILYNVAQSLYNLSSEHLLLQKAVSQNNISDSNITNLFTSSMIVWNQTMALQFALDKGNYSNADDYENDLELSEAFEHRRDEMLQSYESLNSTSELLIYNWFATVEDMFNTSRMNFECSGMSDCTKHILDSLLQTFSVIEADGADHIRKQVKKLQIQLDYLSNSTNTTIEEGLSISSEILSILKKMKEVEMVCAQSPNITKQPAPVTEIGIGKVLVLNCNASGTSLLYSWTFNGKTLNDQNANVLKISNTTVSNSGNYTCIVSNHIAKEKSIPAVVMIHPPPVITLQPVEYLAAVLAEDESLQCEVEENSNTVSYQWWFKPANSSSFVPLPNETFPYLNFSPIKTMDEGWYFCQVSNPYGVTTSQISFVKALSFTLPVPTAVLSFSLDRETEKINSSVQPSNFTSYEVFSSHIMKHILLANDFSDAVRAKGLRPINCRFGKTKNESNDDIGMCSWEFQYIGRNVTSNVTINKDFKVNAGLVVNATQELSDTIERFAKATNNGSLSFSMADAIYFVKRNSIAIHKYSLICPRSQVLLQEDFKCADCPPGYHAVLDDNKKTTCTPCPEGFYQTKAGQITCDSCPKGFTTWNTGSYKGGQCKVICKTGHYGVVTNETGYCVPCPLNKYQPEEGQFECLPCPDNHVTKMEGTVDSTQCMLVEKTDIPSKRTETTPERRTERTTNEPYNNGESSMNDESSENWKIGLSVGCISFVIFIGIVLTIYVRRRKRQREYKVYLQTKYRPKRESYNRNDNPGSDVGCTFQNAIYDDASCVNETGGIKKDGLHRGYLSMEDARDDKATEEKTTTAVHFRNPLFKEMCEEMN